MVIYLTRGQCKDLKIEVMAFPLLVLIETILPQKKTPQVVCTSSYVLKFNDVEQPHE